MANSECCDLRAMTPLDLQHCHAITKRLQWAHRGEDWAQAFRVSKGLVLQTHGKVIGTAVSCIKGRFSSIGLIAIAPEYQRRGLGRKLTEAVLKLATQNVALAATTEGRALYDSLGFKENGIVVQLTLAQQSAAPTSFDPTLNLREARVEDSVMIHRTYRRATGAYSELLLSDLLTVADTVLVAIGPDGDIVGFCIVRPFGHGTVIGPIVAEGVDVAVCLVRACMDRHSETVLRVDVNNSVAFVDALLKLGFQVVGSAIRMYLGTQPELDRNIYQYSIASQALL
jgi:GNAT superfamily N-acetyltransferase